MKGPSEPDVVADTILAVTAKKRPAAPPLEPPSSAISRLNASTLAGVADGWLRPSGRVPLRFLHVDAAGRGLPPMPARPRLRDIPARRLLDPMAGATAGARVTRTGFPTLIIRQGVLEI